MLEVRLIGKFDIECDGKPAVLSSRAAQSLFAYLILTAGTLHRREKLAGMFWPEESEQKARTYLRNELWRIRKALPKASNIEYLIADNLTVGFNPSSPYWLDIAGLKNLSDTSSSEELIEALFNHQGELLPGFYEDWIIFEREHLQVLFEQKIACLLELLEQEKRWQEILEWAERWITQAEAPEAAYRALMLAYDALGDHAKVTSTYERCKQALRQLDLEPSEETRALAFKRSSKIKVPIPLTSFIGRQKELKEVAELFSKSRLITLTGSGGVGKTRLAIQVVAEVLDRFPDGMWFLDLAPLSHPALIPNTLASLIGLRESKEISATELLINYLRTRTALVIFDNCEHMIESCAQLVNSLLTSCENLTVLATSRETLRVSGEIPYRVPSLELPKSGVESSFKSLVQIESVQLFIQRSTLASPSFALTSQNIVTIAGIVQKLDGIPLALELAAARVSVLTLEQILKHLDDRFNILTNGLRSALPRHRTLRATIEWSHELLSEKERILFRRLAVFMGGWTLKAAEEVCSEDDIASSEVLELLSQLVNKSMIVAQVSQNGTRYHMLETLRQYANEKLLHSGENDRLHDNHLEYFLNLAETAEPHLLRREQLEWLERLDCDYENLRLALDCALNKEMPETSLNLCRALYFFWEIRGYWLEGLNWTKRALTKPSRNENLNQKIARARALSSHALHEWQLGNYDRILAPAQASLELAVECAGKRDIAIARYLVGASLRLRGENYDKACSLMEQSFLEFQILDEPFWQARSFQVLSNVLVEQARITAEESFSMRLELARKAGERLTLAEAFSWCAEDLCSMGRVREAKEYAEESDRHFEQINSKIISTNALVFAEAAWVEGDIQKAKSFYIEMQERFSLLGDKFWPMTCNENLGILAIEEGDLELARMYLEQAVVLARQIGFKPKIAKQLAELGNLFYLQDDLVLFKQNIRESFSLRRFFGESYKGYVILITVLGSLYLEKPENSTRLLGVIDNYEKKHGKAAAIERRYCSRAKTNSRRKLGDAKFESLFAEGQRMSIDEGLDLALKTVEEM